MSQFVYHVGRGISILAVMLFVYAASIVLVKAAHNLHVATSSALSQQVDAFQVDGPTHQYQVVYQASPQQSTVVNGTSARSNSKNYYSDL